MTRNTGVHVLKYTVYVLFILICFVLQQTPSLFSVFGVKPVLIVSAAVCIAVFEGEFAGALLGAFAGVLCDMGSITIFGFNGILMLVFCAACGLLILFLLRPNFLSSLMLCAAVLFLRGTLEYLSCLAIWGYESVGMYYLRYTLPCIVYSVAVSPIIFIMVKKIHFAFEERLKD